MKYKDIKATKTIFVINGGNNLDSAISATLSPILRKQVANQLKKKDNSIIHQKNTTIFIAKHEKAAKIEHLAALGAKIAAKSSKLKVDSIMILGDPSTLKSVLTGFLSHFYKFDKFLTRKPKKIYLEKVYLSELIAEVEEMNEAVNFVRDLVNSPPLEITPSHLTDTAKNIAKSSKHVKFSELGEKEMKKSGLNLLLAVSAGSQEEAKLIILEYKNKPKNKKPILLVGKAVTFDAGGLNLKPTNNIETMKMDMAGGATVLGIIKLIANLSLNLHVIGVIPSTENLLGGKAFKPGDIIKSHLGKTVEITNTDAEGRLILADAISYAATKYKPESIVDMATLTGACITALGSIRSGLLSNSKSLKDQLVSASKKTDEKVWVLPLDNYHRKKVKGEISDFKNWTSGVQAGAIMGAAFIEKFTHKIPWAHLDIAGTAFLETKIGYKPKGATGEPLKLIYKFLKDYQSPI